MSETHQWSLFHYYPPDVEPRKAIPGTGWHHITILSDPDKGSVWLHPLDPAEGDACERKLRGDRGCITHRLEAMDGGKRCFRPIGGEQG